MANTRTPPTATATGPGLDADPEERGLRIAVALVLVLVLAAVAVVVVRGGGYEVTARFTDAGQVIVGNEVRVGAAAVGSVTGIALADDGTAELRLAIDDDLAPLARGTIARIRVDSLSGVANRFVSLDVPLEEDAPAIPDGGVIGVDETQSPVDIDAALSALDADTRRGLQSFIAGSAAQLEGRSAEAALTIERLAPALGGLSDVSRAVAADADQLTTLLRDGARAARALAAREADLTSLVGDARSATAALADEEAALGRAITRLPHVLADGTRTLSATRVALDDLDGLVVATRPSTSELPSFLGRLRRLAGAGAAPVADLAATVSRRGKDDDATDLLRDAPALARRARTAFPRAIRAMDASETQLTSLRAYTPEVVGALARVGQVTANYDANGHYARLQPNLLAFDLDTAANALRTRTSGDALSRLPANSGTRCPGASIFPPADGSAPLRLPTCLLTQRPGAG